MSSKLKNELMKLKVSEQSSTIHVTNATDLLIGYDIVDEQLLNKAGLSIHAPSEKSNVESLKKTDAIEKIYKHDSFTGEQIKNLCLKYDLRFLQTILYRQGVDTDVAEKIKNFCEANNLVVTGYDMYILAPSENFSINKTVNKSNNSILFYRTDKNQHRYGNSANDDEIFTQICSWGNDFSELRKLRFMLDDAGKSEQMSNKLTVISSIILNIISMILSYAILKNSDGTSLSLLIVPIIGMILASIPLLTISTELEIDKKWNKWNTGTSIK